MGMHYNPRPEEEGENNNIIGALGELKHGRGTVIEYNYFQNHGNNTLQDYEQEHPF